MLLRTFADKAPATTINAADLDANFKRLRPLPQDGSPRHYYLTETPDGWSFRVLPKFPNGTGPFMLAFANGQLYWAGSGVDEFVNTGTNQGGNPFALSGFLPAYPSGGGGGYYLAADGQGNLYWAGSGVNEPELTEFNPSLFPGAPVTGTYVLGSVNGEIQWLATQSC